MLFNLPEESNVIEYKLELPSDNNKWLSTIVAFSNTAGGKVIVGIEDDTKIVHGIKESRAMLESKIMDTIFNAINPTPVIDISFQNIEDKDVLIIDVSRGNETPYYIKSLEIDKGTYVRFSSSDRVATQAQIDELKLKSKRTVFSNDRYMSKNNEPYELSIGEINEFLDEINKNRRSKKINLSKLLEWEVIFKIFDKYYATNGFMLMNSNPFSYAYIRLGIFRGTDKAKFHDQKSFEGSIIGQYEAVIESLKDILNKGYNLDSVRIKEFAIPEVVIREIVANAVVHRNYMDEHPIRIEVYEDRLSVVSPGSLYDGLQLEEILRGISKVRNKNIAEVYHSLGHIEKWGSGIQRSNYELTEQNMRPLEINHESIHDVTVTVYFDKNDSDAAIKTKFEVSPESVVDYYRGRSNTFKRIDIENDFGITDRQARTIIEKLSNDGVIEKLGSGPATYYEILD